MTTERAGTPGRYWESALVTAEQIVDLDDAESPFGWRGSDTLPDDTNQPIAPQPNRATRRAQQRATRRNR
ncbi:hypothetical protein [Streptomyces sp. NPDC001422]|uniref:hypothetical protein n=1 Tax=Streptomyces sp. NPDC001422 TaxID=3364575 RepID=UPI0036B91E07